MTTHNPKTKRDRAAGRHHRHTAIQTIVNNHQGIIDDIASIDNSIASLQDETCNLGSRLGHWYTILDEKNTHTRCERRRHPPGVQQGTPDRHRHPQRGH